MTVTQRVMKLRQESLDTKPRVSSERAQLITEFYKLEHGLNSVPMRRALAFSYLMARKSIWIGEGELIVGEKGPAPKASPTYPELCCHSLEDLDLLNSRAKIPFAVSPETRRVYEETVLPFWESSSMRDQIFSLMTPEWISAYESGIFTEFMEQRAPGHTVLDNKIYHKGFLDFKADIQASLKKLDFLHDQEAYDKQEELKAMLICIDALIGFAERHAQTARHLAESEASPERKNELLHIALVCDHVPANPPRDFWEALQYYWFVHLGVTCELNTWDSFDPGRLDQHLYPFYKQELEEGKLNRETAEELLQCFWIKFNNQPAPPKVGVTAQESGTYTDFAQINLGGVKEDGSDGVNEVTYLLLDVIEAMRLLQPSSSIQVSRKNPDRFIKRAAKIIRTGYGQPSVFNHDLVIQELIRQGKTVRDARNGGTSGCVETGAFGKESYSLTGYFNLPKVLEITLHNGLDPRIGKRIGLETGDPTRFATFSDLYSAFEKQVNHFIDIKVAGNQVIERLYARLLPCPFLSILIDDCIQKGKDYHDGGARYNTTYIQGVGIGTISDSLSGIKWHIFDQKTFSFQNLLEALSSNFEEQERMRQVLVNKTPKYGNDNDYADSIMERVFETFYNAVEGRKNTKGGEYHIDMLPTTCHVYFGSILGASPDGRRAGMPVSEGISPVQGADRHGPTAVIRSSARMDHVRTGGTLLNQKFTPHLLKDDEGLERLVQMVRAYFKLDGHHIQFNVVDSATLRAAQEDPEKYRDLIVRVAGYSDYFCDLSPTLQEEIIMRTEHQQF